MLFAVLGGAILALPIRYLMRGRETYGNALLSAIGAMASALVWTGLTWLGWQFDGGWIWVVSLLVAPLVALVFSLLLPRRRHRADAALLETLSKA